MIPNLPADAEFFPVPPRSRGRGWWRRLRRLIRWFVLGGAALAVLGALLVQDVRDILACKRVVARGEVGKCRVVSLRKTQGRSPDYYVTIRVIDPRVSSSREVEVDAASWRRARVGLDVPYYHDPATGFGVSELERGRRESWWLAVVLVAGIAVVSAWGWASCRRLAREMRLLRFGLERMARLDGGTAVVAHEGRTVALKLESAERHVQLGERPPGVLALVLPDLSQAFLPELADVPVGRLVRDESITPVLPAPVRDGTPALKQWLRVRNDGFRAAVWILGVVGGATVLITGLGDGFGHTSFWTVLAVLLGLETLVALAWMRRHLRDVVLWKEGDEVHAVILTQSHDEKANRWLLDVAFTYQGRERTGRQRLPKVIEPLRVASPADAPAVTPRVVVLVDPYRPKRWMVVASSLG